jgi:Lon protease-like protein
MRAGIFSPALFLSKEIKSMSNKNWLPGDYDFDEILEEKESYVDKCSHIKEVAIYPQELVVLPYEWMTLKISDPSAKQLFEDVESDEVYLGIGEQIKGEKALPVVGSIGVGADVEEIDKKSLGNAHLVKIRGVVRFRIDEYVETDKPYAVARITFFEDDKITNPNEKQMLPEMFIQLRELMRQYNRLAGKHKHLENLPDMMKKKYLEEYSFFYWVFAAELTPELRKMLLEMRSTVQRAYCLNRQIERVIKRIKKTKPAGLN